MANELRKRQNFLAGTITDNPLLIGATTINSVNLAKVAGDVGAAEHMAITLDPAGAAGDPEIVYITAHTALTTVATIVRAQEGTVAREHTQGVVWSHSPTVRDIPQQPHFASGAGVSNALDDEFDGATVNPAWGKVDPAGNVITATQGRGLLSLSIPGGDPVARMHGFVKPMGAFAIGQTLETRMSIGCVAGSSPMGGLVVCDGTTHGAGNQAVNTVWQSSTRAQASRDMDLWTSDPAIDSNDILGVFWPAQTYMRLRWNAANSFISSYSPDGLSWASRPARTTTQTPTHIGLFCSSWGLGAGFYAFTYDYFRVF